MWLSVGYWTYTPKFRRTFAIPRSWHGHHRDARLLRTRLQRTHSRAAHTRLLYAVGRECRAHGPQRACACGCGTSRQPDMAAVSNGILSRRYTCERIRSVSIAVGPTVGRWDPR